MSMDIKSKIFAIFVLIVMLGIVSALFQKEIVYAQIRESDQQRIVGIGTEVGRYQIECTSYGYFQGTNISEVFVLLLTRPREMLLIT